MNKQVCLFSPLLYEVTPEKKKYACRERNVDTTQTTHGLQHTPWHVTGHNITSDARATRGDLTAVRTG